MVENEGLKKSELFSLKSGTNYPAEDPLFYGVKSALNYFGRLHSRWYSFCLYMKNFGDKVNVAETERRKKLGILPESYIVHNGESEVGQGSFTKKVRARVKESGNDLSSKVEGEKTLSTEKEVGDRRKSRLDCFKEGFW